MARAFVALGSNLDQPAAQLRAALLALQNLPQTSLIRASRLYWTPPWGLLDQPRFVNAVAELDTHLAPDVLLVSLKSIEQDAGRDRSAARWGPRRLDLDLLLYDALCLDSPELQLPHPRLAQRAFVLLPLAEIAADLVLPDGRALGDLLRAVDTSGIEPVT